jgi:hypothetical protein
MARLYEAQGWGPENQQGFNEILRLLYGCV